MLHFSYAGATTRNGEIGDKGSEDDLESDGDDDEAILDDDVDLQILLGEHVASSQLDQAYYFVQDEDAIEEMPQIRSRTHDDNHDANEDQGDAPGDCRQGPHKHHSADQQNGSLSNQEATVAVGNFLDCRRYL